MRLESTSIVQVPMKKPSNPVFRSYRLHLGLAPSIANAVCGRRHEGGSMERFSRICLGFLGAVLLATVARADVVTDWNLIAAQTVAAVTPASHARPGPSAILDLAALHAAMHD